MQRHSANEYMEQAETLLHLSIDRYPAPTNDQLIAKAQVLATLAQAAAIGELGKRLR